MVGAQTRIRSTQNAKNEARLATRAAQPANRSKKPIRLETSVGIVAGCLVLVNKPSFRGSVLRRPIRVSTNVR